MAFVGATGFNVENGFTCQNSIESQVKSRILARARHAYIVADSSKWGTVAFSTFARPENIEALVTDDNLPRDARADLEAAGTFVVTPSESDANDRKSQAKESKRNVAKKSHGS